tara:strand:- start:603 stop:737 length:135 start_codon:yes stop_codon:yes gene_type:complete
MKWVTKIDGLKNLQDELRRLETAGHTIDQVLVVDGYPVIISTTV